MIPSGVRSFVCLSVILSRGAPIMLRPILGRPIIGAR